MFDVRQSIHDRHGEIDPDRASKYIDGLMKEFAASPEGQPVYAEGGGSWPAMMMQYAVDYQGATPPEMSLADFNEVVFGLFPRKVSTEPESAPEIVAELRAFWAFLQRQYGLPNARQMLAALGDDAVDRLRKELADPSNYGMAKSFFMLGSKAGFDMTTQEGLDRFMLAYNSGLMGAKLPAPLGIPPDYHDDFDDDDAPPRPAQPGQSREDRRKERKRQRQARKRNRR